MNETNNFNVPGESMRRCSISRSFAQFLLLAFILPSLPACGWLDSVKAEGVTKRFVRAAAAADYVTIRQVTDSDRDYDNAKYVIEREFGAVDRRRRLDGLSLETVSNDGERAVVEAVGTLRYSIPFLSAAVPIELEVELIKKRHTWYVHDVDAL